jgi:hypothetical protein
VVMIRSIANIMKNSGCDVPEWILNIEKAPYAPVTTAPRARHMPGQPLLFFLLFLSVFVLLFSFELKLTA